MDVLPISIIIKSRKTRKEQEDITKLKNTCKILESTSREMVPDIKIWIKLQEKDQELRKGKKAYASQKNKLQNP